MNRPHYLLKIINFVFLVCIFLFFAILAGALTNSADAEQRVNSKEDIIFIIPIETKMFSESATLTVRIWNAKQLEISEKTSDCAVSYDTQTRREEIHCPEGVKYQKPTPEEFLFSVQQIYSFLEIKSNLIKIGERYRLQISGLSTDNCNTSSASVSSKAVSKIIRLENLSWRTTSMACL